MNRCGIVEVRETGREKHYWIRAADWKGLLRRPDEPPPWRTWPPLWSALDQIWLKLHDPQLETLEPLMLSSALRQLMVKVRPAIERAGFGKNLSDDRQHLGESYLPVFLSDVSGLLDAMSLKQPNQAI